MEHLTSESFRRLRQGELAGEELIAALRHASSCPSCSTLGDDELASDVAALQETILGASTDEHPDLDSTLIPFVAGSSDRATREIVETHLADCAQCRADVDGLRALAQSERPRRTMTWIAVAAAIVIAIALAVMWTTRRPSPSPAPPIVSTAPRTTTAAQPPYTNARWEALVRDAVQQARLPFPHDLASLRDPEDPLRTPEEHPNRPRLTPSGIVVDETRPRFSWPAWGQATYVVSVFDGDTRIARSDVLARAEWIPMRDLPRGRTLLWQVEVRRDGSVDLLPSPPAPQAKFRVTGDEEHADLTEAKRQSADPLLLAVLNARAGLRDEALRALRRVDLTRHPEAARLLDQSAERGDPTRTAADQ